MSVIGAATVQVVPSFQGFQKSVGKEVATVMPEAGKQAGEQFEKGAAGPSIGARIGSGLRTGLKRSAQVTGLAVAGVLGLALKKGFSRLNSIEQATASLRGLGHSARETQQIMNDALKSVKGTAFGMDEAAQTAAGAVAAGIKPGKELQRVLRLVADSATIAKIPMKDMGAIWNKVATSNKLQGDVIAQLNDRGIPIVQLLAKSLHKSTDEVLELSKKGKISFNDFATAMQKGVGGAALKSGDTTQGAFKNMLASLSRIGANLLSGVFPQFQRAFVAITKAMSPLEGQAESVGKVLGKWVSKGMDLVIKYAPIAAAQISRLMDAIRGDGQPRRLSGIARVTDALKNIDLSKASESFHSIGQSMRKLGPLVGDLARSLPGIAPTAKVLSVVMKTLADHVDLLGKAMPFLLAGFAAYKTAQLANQLVGRQSLVGFGLQLAAQRALIVSNRQLAASVMQVNGAQAAAITTGKASIATRVRGRIVTIAKTVAEKAAAAATKAMTIAQRILNGVLRANPIGLVITALLALGAGLVLAYKKSETFRKIVDGAWRAVKSAASAVVNWFTDTAWPALSGFFTSVKDKAVWLYQKGIRDPFNWIRDKVRSVKNWLIGTAGPAITGFLGGIRDKAVAIWDGAGHGLRWVFDKISAGVGSVKDAFGAAKRGISKAWSGFKSVVTAPIRAAMKAIHSLLISPIDKMLSKVGVNWHIPWPKWGMATGGPVPGHSPTPTADNIPIMATADEYMLPVHAHHRLRSRYGEAGMESLRRGYLPTGYAAGGRIDRGGSYVSNQDILRRASKFTESADADYSGPVGWAVDLLRKLRDKLAGWASGGNVFTRFLAGAGKTAVGKLIGLVTNLFTAKSIGGQGTWVGPALSGVGKSHASWSQLWGMVKSHFPGAVLTSGYRPGAITATGYQSRHALGKAIDIAPSFAIWKWLWARRNSFRELYGPWGGWLLGGLRSRFPGAALTLGNHRDHIHLASYARGGPVRPDKPLLFDAGGILPPGYSTVLNATRKPEPLARVDKASLIAGDRPVAIAGELELRGGKAYIRGVLAESGTAADHAF